MMDEAEVKRWLVRAWGNVYIGYENNKLPIGTMNDLDSLAHAFGLTDEDKEYAINLMGGDMYSYVEAEIALMKFKKRSESTPKGE